MGRHRRGALLEPPEGLLVHLGQVLGHDREHLAELHDRALQPAHELEDLLGGVDVEGVELLVAGPPCPQAGQGERPPQRQVRHPPAAPGPLHEDPRTRAPHLPPENDPTGHGHRTHRRCPDPCGHPDDPRRRPPAPQTGVPHRGHGAVRNAGLRGTGPEARPQPRRDRRSRRPMTKATSAPTRAGRRRLMTGEPAVPSRSTGSAGRETTCRGPEDTTGAGSADCDPLVPLIPPASAASLAPPGSRVAGTAGAAPPPPVAAARPTPTSAGASWVSGAASPT